MAVTLLLFAAAILRLYRLDVTPPGLHVDLGINGLNARDVLSGHWQVFFPRHEGREALYMYFLAGLMAFGGQTPFIFNYAAFVMGMLSVALAYRLFWAWFGKLTGWLAAALFAVSFVGIDTGRYGERAGALLPCLLAAMYMLWRLLRTGQWRCAALAGLAGGLSLYTYISARLIPPLLALLCLADLQAVRKCWRQLALLAVVLVAVFAPEGVYFLRHPDQMLLRTAQVSVFNPTPRVEESHDTPVQSALNTAGMFFVRGDENQRNNLPNRPLFDPLAAVLFVAGVVLAARRARGQPAYRWLFLWLVVMSLPSALSQASPNWLRAIGAMPVAFAFPAIALAAVCRAIKPPLLRGLVPAAVVGLSGAFAAGQYFGQWAHDPKTYWAYDGNLPKLSAFLQPRPEQRIYLSLASRPSVEFLAPSSLGGRWYAEDSAAIPIPAAPGGDVLYVSGPHAALADLAPAMLPGLQQLPNTTDPSGGPDFLAFHWPAAAAAALLAGAHPLQAEMAPDFRLAGYSLGRRLGGIALSLFWRSLQAAGPYDLYVHLLDASGKQVAQSDRLVWPIDEGPADDGYLLTVHDMAAPAGSYTAEIGAVHRKLADPAQLQGGPIGHVVRLPIDVAG